MILQYLGIGFAAGILAGIGLIVIFAVSQVKRVVRDIKEDIEKQKKEAEAEHAKVKKSMDAKRKFDEIVAKQLNEAGKIIETQNNIATALRQPSKNALHSKHKNKMVSDWKILDNKRNEIFSKILKAGADPLVNVYDNTIKKTKEMKLSQLMQIIGSSVIPLEPNEDTKKIQATVGKDTSVKKVVKNGKVFHLIEGGKGNKTNH